MLRKLHDEVNNWPPDKTSRWIGYIQHFIISKNLTTSLMERDFSRPLFHKAYKELGYDIPETVEIK